MRPESDLGAILSSDEIASPAIDYDENTGVYRAQFDLYSRSASEAIIAAMTAATGKDPLELPPLYSVIDSDELESLETSTNNSTEQLESMTFEYDTCLVSVEGYGIVSVDPAGDGCSE